VKHELRSLIRSWGELASKFGFFVLLVVGSATMGVVIAWPLWYFATSARAAYTVFALLLALAGVVFAIVRSVIKRRNATHEASGRRRPLLSSFLVILQVLILLSGLYVAAVLFYHGIWVFAIPLLVACFGLLVLLGLARRASKISSDASVVPKIRKE
jgi:uncharacterized membrane-anchored protein